MILDDTSKRLLDHLTTGLLLMDGDLHLLFMNAAAESLLDISNRKAHKLHLGDLLVNAREDIREMTRAVADDAAFTRREVELQVARGRTIMVDYSISPFSDDDQTRVLLELNSLGQARRMGQEESLHLAHATTRELVRGLAHEIKNPLGGIRGAAQLLAKEIDGAEFADYTNVIIKEADRLHKLVDRMTGPRRSPLLDDINIHEVLERVRSLVAAEVSGLGIDLVRDYDPSIPALRGDAGQLIQALLNVVRNAMQSLTGTAALDRQDQIVLCTRIVRNITIGSRHCRLAAKIEVIDNGPGVPADMIDTIFYPMISGRPEGAGLGLSIAHGIVNQHQGIIECASRPGRTRFSVVLPVAPIKGFRGGASAGATVNHEHG